MAQVQRVLVTLILTLLLAPSLTAQEAHAHAESETLGEVSFPISCKPEVQKGFTRGIALLHSFAYTMAEKAFHGVVEQDPGCAMAHWGIAMTYFHQLWEPSISPAAIPAGQREIRRAGQTRQGTEREHKLVHALALIYQNAATVSYRQRATNYEQAMRDFAAENSQDIEAQVFYALALLANASPADKTHARQKQALDLLEPLYRAHPQHPGIPHYIIHACDNAELASRGLPAARAYSRIAASAPHALHMPSHIFTRLGLWEDSIASNSAARDAARGQGDTGEELHSMDYLVYAYLQSGRDSDAAQVMDQLRSAQKVNHADFKAAYAVTAMPVRYAIERHQWSQASDIALPPPATPPHVVAIAVWARGVGLARNGRASEATKEVGRLRKIEEQLRASANEYWATQVQIMMREVSAWSAQAENKPEEALAGMREAADAEDGSEKLPVTPGPIVPAREQLGELLLKQNQPRLALKEFAAALVNAPGRRGAMVGAAESVKWLGNKQVNTAGLFERRNCYAPSTATRAAP